MPLVCCHVIKQGRFVAAHPWFVTGHPIALGSAREYADCVGKLVLIEVDDVTEAKRGRFVEVLGSLDNVHAAMRGLLAEADLLSAPDPAAQPNALARAVESELAELSASIPEEESRVDHRSDLVVTIDPPTAKDFDDAIGLQRAPAGADYTWLLAVHIADVSAYVATGSAIDQQALQRAMSAYIPGTVAPMLPPALSSDLCSLRPGVDRGCLSVFIRIDDAGRVVGSRSERTIIRSAKRLTYDQVDAYLRDQQSIDPVIDPLLSDLDELTRLLNQRRMRQGALDMAIPDVEFTLGKHIVKSARLEAGSVSHRLVEECMLAANDAIGLLIAESAQPGIWRVHEHPDPAALAALLQSFAKLGIPTPPMPDHLSEKDAANLAVKAAKLAQRYAEQKRRGVNAYAPRVLRALQRAIYRAKPGPHSGLSTENYAHFTSPIRRYPDLVMHRSLLNFLGLSDQEAATQSLAEIAQHVSEVERELIDLERRADKIALAYLLHRKLHTGEPLGDRGSGRWRGEIVGLIPSGMFIRFGDVFEGFVPARTLSPNERYELDEDGLAMVGTRSQHQYRIGDSLDVRLERVERSSGRIDLRLYSAPHDPRGRGGSRSGRGGSGGKRGGSGGKRGGSGASGKRGGDGKARGGKSHGGGKRRGSKHTKRRR